jgi:hypothetical protein
LLIGVVLALEESIQRAIVGDMAKDKEAIAYGYYHLIYGLASATGGYLVGYLAQNSLIIQLTMLSIILSLVGALVFSTVRELNLDL